MAGDAEVGVDAAAADDEFNLGFEDSPTATPDAPLEDQSKPAAEVVEPPKLAQITEAQYQDLLTRAASVDEMRAAQEKSFGTAFGKIGGIERVLTQLQAGTPNGQAIEVTAEDFSELREEFPELAELQAKGLNKILGKLKDSGPADAGAIERLVSERVDETRRQLVDSHLDTVVNGDWVSEVNSDRYKAWIATQSDDVRALEASDSVRDASRVLRLFKAATPAPVSKPSTRKQQLEAAVTPRSAGGHTRTPSDDDDFTAGFTSG